MGSCSHIVLGIALILVVPLCSSLIMPEFFCLYCDEVSDLADCSYTEAERCHEGCYLEVRGDFSGHHQRIKAGCGSYKHLCHHHKRGDHDFCDFHVLCHGYCAESNDCNRNICDLPLYGHYSPTTTVLTTKATTKTTIKTTPPATTTPTTPIPPSTPPATTTATTPIPPSTSSATTTATTTTPPSTQPSPKQQTSTSGTTITTKVSTTQTSTTSSKHGSSTNSIVSTTGSSPQTTTGRAGVLCETCSGPMCGLFPVQTAVQCSGATPYCMNTLVNHLDTTKTITKSCATVEACRAKWWHQTSDRGECTGFNPGQPIAVEFTCNFCCVKDNCNKPIVPAIDTLFRD
ncbi:cell wall protein DAN4-like isoform X2 [Haliotis rufescens]|uniref:cell wall protein DAN4-like isoform X2 n=1 Tax=Haliotis rufescens TaxID=6454 RepID=UPI00201F423A|nr:cell wall protein DAN4-like isoform X2 [Haliotis rufescens]